MRTGLALAAAFGLGGAVGVVAVLAPYRSADDRPVPGPTSPVWTEVHWPFPMDQWGKGRAFQCKPADCGAKVELYLRAKLGSCNCATGIEDDSELERMSDLTLIGGEVSPRGPGEPITVAWMKGRSRAYAIRGADVLGRTALSVAFNDRCDMVVATAVLSNDIAAAIEPHVITFLNSSSVLGWAEVALGL
jgi:hypothetical protein